MRETDILILLVSKIDVASLIILFLVSSLFIKGNYLANDNQL
jgi:hypothetical protein